MPSLGYRRLSCDQEVLTRLPLPPKGLKDERHAVPLARTFKWECTLTCEQSHFIPGPWTYGLLLPSSTHRKIDIILGIWDIFGVLPAL